MTNIDMPASVWKTAARGARMTFDFFAWTNETSATMPPRSARSAFGMRMRARYVSDPGSDARLKYCTVPCHERPGTVDVVTVAGVPTRTNGRLEPEMPTSM